MLDPGPCGPRHSTAASSRLCPLHRLTAGAKGVVRRVDGCGAERGRLLALGFVAGKPVEVLQNAHGPMVVLLDTGRVCLCRHQARHVLVELDTPNDNGEAETSPLRPPHRTEFSAGPRCRGTGWSGSRN